MREHARQVDQAWRQVQVPLLMTPRLKPVAFEPAVFNPAVFKPAVFQPAVFKPALFKPAAFKPAVLKSAVFKSAEWNQLVGRHSRWSRLCYSHLFPAEPCTGAFLLQMFYVFAQLCTAHHHSIG